MNFGFVRVAAAVPDVKVANCIYNANEIIKSMKKAYSMGAEVCLFPELSLTGYTCGDLFQMDSLHDSVMQNLYKIVKASEKLDGMISIIGMPIRHQGRLYNCAVVIQLDMILGVVPKTYIPQYSEFYDKRWFSSPDDSMETQMVLLDQSVSFGTDFLFSADEFTDFTFGIEICEDVWAPIPPSSKMALGGATVIFNLSASNETIGKHDYRRNLISQQSARCISSYIYCSAGIGESTTDLVFGGYACVCENGKFLSESKRFTDADIVIGDIDVNRLVNERRKNTTFYTNNDWSFEIIDFAFNPGLQYQPGRLETIPELHRFVDPHPFVPMDKQTIDERCNEIFNIQTSGLIKRMKHTGCQNAVIGISGGLDSTLALLVLVGVYDKLKLDRSLITAITMPGFGTTDNTYNNAVSLIKSLKATFKEIPIGSACLEHFKAIGHPGDVHDVTYENVQARERTQILMDYANMVNGLVIGTGDMSELALGWCTYNGDHMSNYGVNAGVPKTLVRHLVQWVADNISDNETKRILYDVINTPISPELLPPDSEGLIAQKTEDIVGPYELHDFFLYHFVKYGATPEKILFLAQIAYNDKYEYSTLLKWLITFIKRFFSQQFKRSCMPDGPKVGTIALSPRGDWRMPSDASPDIWLERLFKL